MTTSYNSKGLEYIKLIKVLIGSRGKTKIPQDFTKATNLSYDDPSLLRHLEKGYNYGILGGPDGFIEINADHEPCCIEQLELVEGYLKRNGEEKMGEIEVKRLYLVIPQPLFGELQTLGFMGGIDTVIAKLLCTNVEERKEEEKENGRRRRF